MKILCFSDSHNNAFFMKKAIRANSDADAIFFLGDGIEDVLSMKADFPDKAFYIVKGNCDTGRAFAFNPPIKKTETVDILGKRITLTHGDLYGAKFGTAGLEKLAIETNSDIVVFGHTHRPESLYFPEKENTAEDEPSAAKRFYLFNPGSVGEGYPLSFGIITIIESGGEPLFSHGQLL